MTAYLQNSLGFFIQFFPCALMIFLPFPQDSYRFRRGRIFICVTVAAIITAAMFPAAMQRGYSGNAAYIANVFMFSAILLTMLAYIWLVRESLIKKLLVFFVVLFYATLQYCLVNALNGLLPGFYRVYEDVAEWAVYSPSGVLLYLITAAFLLPMMLSFVIRILREYITKVETRSMRREFIILIASTTVFVIMIICVDFSYYYMEYRLYLLLLTMFLVMLVDQVLIYWLIFRESLRREADNERKRTLEIQHLQYERIMDDMENTRRMRHDLRHHYTSLSDMLDRGKLDEMREYLSEVIDMTVRRDNEAYCKNMTVNGLLQYYIGMARDADISCDVCAECGELDIDSADLTVLFANSFENAIRACKSFSEDRRISVRIGTVQGSFAIEITNSCKEARIIRRFRTEDGFLPAEAFLSGRAGGGYGLTSIARTAQKYGGSAMFRFDAEKEIFTARIRLNNHSDV